MVCPRFLSYRDAADTEIDRIDYAYDPAGQRILKDHEQGLANQETPLVATYDDANRMVTFNGHALTYDANGNLTRRDTAEGPVTYTWNARDELVAIAGPHGTASFAYDHLGRRIEKTVNGVTTGYLYHGAQAIAELNGTSIAAAYHVGLAIDEVVARYTDEGERSLLSDALGSVVALADETGMVSTRYGYSPYGETAEAGEENDNPLKYTGREDDGTGVYYYRARYYDPELKRFVSVDPIGLAGGVNVYAYVGNNPLDQIDPHGLAPLCPPSQRGVPMKNYENEYPKYIDCKPYADSGYRRDPGPFGQICGAEGSAAAYWIPDITPGACARHDKCYDDCAKRCAGDKCKQQCDFDLMTVGRNLPYGTATYLFGDDAYDAAKRKRGCACDQ